MSLWNPRHPKPAIMRRLQLSLSLLLNDEGHRDELNRINHLQALSRVSILVRRAQISLSAGA